MTQQLLNWQRPESYLEEDYIVTSCNRDAYNWVVRWPDWPSHRLLIVGAPSSGKTHLATLWSQRSQALLLNGAELHEQTIADYVNDERALAIDGIEQVKDEESLLHVINACANAGRPLVMTAVSDVATLPFTLKDLTSRLQMSLITHIGQPDEVMLHALLTKLFSDKQIKVSNEVMNYLVTRMERSFSAAYYWAELLDEESLRTKRGITLPFIKSLLVS